MRKYDKSTEIDFCGDFIEEKEIFYGIEDIQRIRTSLSNVSGTLFVNDNKYDDLILEI